MAKDDFTADLIEDILVDIAISANALKSSIYSSAPEGVIHDRDKTHTILASQIGWMADLALKNLKKHTTIGEADDWFMSPRYHAIKDRAMEVHHD